MLLSSVDSFLQSISHMTSRSSSTEKFLLVQKGQWFLHCYLYQRILWSIETYFFLIWRSSSTNRLIIIINVEIVTSNSSRNKPKILTVIWGPGIKKLGILNFFQGQIWFFQYILYIRNWNEPTFSRAFWALGFNILWALTKFWGQLAPGPTLFWPWSVIYSIESIHFTHAWSQTKEVIPVVFPIQSI